jgi:dolichol-phosphate mannosyltransferase
MTTCAVIPTYNEAESIADLVVSLQEYVQKVIVTDAGSDDSTCERAREAGAHVIMEPQYHPTIRIGMIAAWKYAIEWESDFHLVQIDAGASHNPHECERLFDALDWGAEMVIGSRFTMSGVHSGNGRRKLLSRIMAVMFNARYKTRFSDVTSGYRAFTGSSIKLLLQHDYQANRHGWQIEVLKQAVRSNLAITEVPITYKAGRSSRNKKIFMEVLRQWAY